MSAEFDPLSLSPHLWLDPSDLTTLFQDSAMTTPVTADGDPVGAILDKSGNENHLTGSSPGTYHTAGGLHWVEVGGIDFTSNLLLVDYDQVIDQPTEIIAALRMVAANQLNAAFNQTIYTTDFDNRNIVFAVDGALSINASTSLAFTGEDPSFGEDFVVNARFNGTESRVNVDASSYSEGDAGALGSAGIRLGDSCPLTRHYGLFVFDRLLLDPEIALLTTYLASKQGRVL